MFVILTSIRHKVADRDLIAIVPEGSWLKDRDFFTDEASVKPQLWTL